MSAQPLLARDRIEIVAVDPEAPFPEGLKGAWPCPVCGHRRPFRGARLVWVINQDPPAHERAVVVCRGCFETLGAAAELTPQDRGAEQGARR